MLIQPKVFDLHMLHKSILAKTIIFPEGGKKIKSCTSKKDEDPSPDFSAPHNAHAPCGVSDFPH